MHGIQGLAWGPDGYLYAGAIAAQRISKIHPATGNVETVVDAPLGEADDLALAEDGTLAWTAIVAGELRLRKPDGAVVTIAASLPGINPVAFRKDGRFVAGQLGFRDALFEFDPSGKTGPRLITDAVKGLNSFEFGSDGRLYAPYWQAGILVAIDIDSGEIEEIAKDLGTPSAVSLDSQGRMVTVDYLAGKIQRTDPQTGKTELITTVAPPLDNLAVGPDDTIYVSDTANSGILAINPTTGEQRTIVGGAFSTPGDLKITTVGGSTALVVADSTGFRFVDPVSGTVTRPPFNFAAGGSLSIDATDEVLAFADARSGRIHMINRKSGDMLWNTMGAQAPYGVLIADSETAIVTEYSMGALRQYNGNAATLIVDGLDGPVGITRAGPRSVYVTENNSGHITLIDLVEKTKVRVASGLDRPEGLALMKDGRLAVVEAATNSLSAIDLATGEKTVLASGLPLNVAVILAPEAVGMPAGVAVAADGAIYVSCAGDSSIRKITIDGN
ncbi:MAG: PQQ-binding-like beta-propeller repeat protein [Gammaproteobacteria bacterium]|jgi:sugar lactone lactonase YvrE|nr:PQQ-binding-like beta-propeller repeat protein [Chromatiales bacterium]